MNFIIQEKNMTIEERDLVDKAPKHPCYDWDNVDWKHWSKDECFECKKVIYKNIDIHSNIFSLPFGKNGFMCVGSAGYILCKKCSKNRGKLKNWKLTMNYPYTTRPLYAGEELLKKARICGEDCPHDIIIDIKVNDETLYKIDL